MAIIVKCEADFYRYPKIEEIDRDAIDSLARVAVMPSDPNIT